MSNIVIRPKDRAEWLEYRKDGIGSSEEAERNSVFDFGNTGFDDECPF